MKNRVVKKVNSLAICCIMVVLLLVQTGSHLMFTFAADDPNPDDYSELIYSNNLASASAADDWTLAGNISFDNGGMHIIESGRAVSPSFSPGKGLKIVVEFKYADPNPYDRATSVMGLANAKGLSDGYDPRLVVNGSSFQVYQEAAFDGNHFFYFDNSPAAGQFSDKFKTEIIVADKVVWVTVYDKDGKVFWKKSTSNFLNFNDFTIFLEEPTNDGQSVFSKVEVYSLPGDDTATAPPSPDPSSNGSPGDGENKSNEYNDDWYLIFYDDFSEAGLDASKWEITSGKPEVGSKDDYSGEGKYVYGLHVRGEQNRAGLFDALLSNRTFNAARNLKIEYDAYIYGGDLAGHTNGFVTRDASGENKDLFIGLNFPDGIPTFAVEPDGSNLKGNSTIFNYGPFSWRTTFKVVAEIVDGICTVTVYTPGGGLIWRSAGNPVTLDELRIGFEDKTFEGKVCVTNLKVYSGQPERNEIINTYLTEDFETEFVNNSENWITSETGVKLDTAGGNSYVRVTAAGDKDNVGDMAALYTNAQFPINDSLTLEYDMNIVKASNQALGSASVQTTMGKTTIDKTFKLDFLSDKSIITDRAFNMTADEKTYADMNGWKFNEWYHYKLILAADSLQTIIATTDGSKVLWDSKVNMEIQDVGFAFCAMYDGDIMIDNVKITGVQLYGVIPEPKDTSEIVDPLPPDTTPVNKDLISSALEDVVKAGDKSLLVSGGTYYTATVPDTIDLAERAALFARGLTNVLVMPGEGGTGADSHAGVNYVDYMPYAVGNFTKDKGVLTNYWIGGSFGCWPKDLEAILLCRNMSGGKENLEIDNKTYESILKFTRDDPYNTMNRVDATLNRLQLALTSVYHLNPSENLKLLINEMSRALRKTSHEVADYAFSYDEPIKDMPSYRGLLNYCDNVFYNANYMRSLTRWDDIGGGGYPYAMQLVNKLSKYVTQPMFWGPEVTRKAVYSPDIAEFDGHMHSYTSAALGLLRYAEKANDIAIMEFVREIYEQQKNYGLANIGLYGEACSLGDMMLLAARLSVDGVGDYWDDLERYIRNQMAECQITDAAKLQAALNQHNPLSFSQVDASAPYGTTTDTVNRTLGICFSGLTYPTHIQADEMEWVACCLGNLPQGMYYAWQSIVTESNGIVSVNMPLNRASEWLDVDSYIPYEGKVVLRNKKAEEVSFRIPNYAIRADVKVLKNGKAVSFNRIGAYLYIKGLKPNDEVTITFPLAQWTETRTLKWREDDTRKECTNPSVAKSGRPWEALENPDKFTFTFIGNTVVKIVPSIDRMTDNDTGIYKLYERDHMLNATTTPMKTIELFVPDTLINW